MIPMHRVCIIEKQPEDEFKGTKSSPCSKNINSCSWIGLADEKYPALKLSSFSYANPALP